MNQNTLKIIDETQNKSKYTQSRVANPE
jgi:hypothetical protein